ncbi:MAG TPA: cytochrome c3 family protein, partial [Gemmatimonadaceae bacterium]|nr:cytochrome c3 family protein [Gemmatimonadaceae bacterium]
MSMRTLRYFVGLAAVAIVASGTVAWARTRDEHRFPHRAHEKLFPTCTGCHAGIVSGTSATAFPAPAACATCHNGTDAKLVVWNGPSHTASNLHFDHATHAKEMSGAGEKVDCLRCHGEGATVATRPWMVVQRAPPAECIGCHAHEASSHLATDARCETCHVPLARAVALSDSAIAGFPSPPSHDDPNWIATHAPRTDAALVQCATCHTRESCARCHVNASTLASVQSLASDARVARIVRGRAPRYPVPPSHRTASFAQRHGALASAGAATCANCHSQSSCQTCHIGTMGARVIAKLPRPIPGSAAGVRLQSADPSFGGYSPRAEGPSAPGDERRDEYVASTGAQDTARAHRAIVLSDTVRPTRV